jgi:cupin superfamily acireductone dioxygenase involved in methionine salvage
MASAAQERANRLNAARSTGLTSRQVVLFSEDKEDYEELRRQFYEDH